VQSLSTQDVIKVGTPAFVNTLLNCQSTKVLMTSATALKEFYYNTFGTYTKVVMEFSIKFPNIR